MYTEQVMQEGPMESGPIELGPKTPSRQYFLREYPITIDFLSIGCVVKIGCKSIPFQNIDEAMSAINAYVANPKEEQEKWRKILD